MEEQPETAAPEPVEEEEKVLTLDEWKAQQEASRIKAEFNIRKPGEGCAADPQWKKMVVLKKKEEEVEEEEEEYVSFSFLSNICLWETTVLYLVKISNPASLRRSVL